MPRGVFNARPRFFLSPTSWPPSETLASDAVVAHNSCWFFGVFFFLPRRRLRAAAIAGRRDQPGGRERVRSIGRVRAVRQRRQHLRPARRPRRLQSKKKKKDTQKIKPLRFFLGGGPKTCSVSLFFLFVKSPDSAPRKWQRCFWFFFFINLKQKKKQGDSGGPLMLWDGRRYTEIGVVSWGRDCGRATPTPTTPPPTTTWGVAGVGGRPGVFTRVSSHVEWIGRVTAASSSSSSCRKSRDGQWRRR